MCEAKNVQGCASKAINSKHLLWGLWKKRIYLSQEKAGFRVSVSLLFDLRIMVFDGLQFDEHLLAVFIKTVEATQNPENNSEIEMNVSGEWNEFQSFE